MIDKSASVKALLRAHQNKIDKTSAALQESYIRLKTEKPSHIWSKRDLWSGAGLKSANALNSPQHAKFLLFINDHNFRISRISSKEVKAPSERLTATTTIERLKGQIRELQMQRDQACNLNSNYQLEADFYAKENIDLKKQIDRLEKDRDQWKNKLLNKWAKKNIDEE